MVCRRTTVFLAITAMGLVSCVDDTVVQSVQTSGEGRFKRGHAPRIEVTTGGLNVHTEGFVLKISPGGFCSPDRDQGCDLSDPADNEKIGATLKIINTGELALSLKEVSIASEPPGALRLQAQAPLSLPGDDDVSLYSALGSDNPRVMYVDVYLSRQPEGAASPTGVLSVRSNSRINDSELIEIPVEIGGLAPQITVNPSAVDFGHVGHLETGTRQLQVINTGLSTLEITGFVLSGHSAFGFAHGGERWSVSPQTQNPGVTFDAPVEVQPGESIQSIVRFQPEAPSPAQGELLLLSNDPSQAQGTLVKLRGNQTGPCLSINPKEVHFGGKLIGKMATVKVELHSCGQSPVRIRGMQLDETGSPDFRLNLGELPGLEPGTRSLSAATGVCGVDTDCGQDLVCFDGACAVELDINETATFEVSFTPDEINPLDTNGQPVMDLGVIHVVSDAFVSEQEVDVRGFGVEVECPTAVIQVVEGEEVIPQTKLHLIGSHSYAASGGISKYEWSVTQPVGSQSLFYPTYSQADPTFDVNAAGTYLFELRVWDDNGEESCVPAQKQVVVVPDEAIHVELLWDTPNDPDQTNEGSEAGADLDLHFMHWFASGGCDVDLDGTPDGWFDVPFDVSWINDNPNWGSLSAGVDDNPGLDLDDTDGVGPENLNLKKPEDGGKYTVGVHYWDDHGFGPSLATVRIFIYSTLVFEISGVELMPGDLWEVADIAWPSGQVSPITGVTGGYKIFSDVNHCP